jgi:hypothetical protein
MNWFLLQRLSRRLCTGIILCLMSPFFASSAVAVMIIDGIGITSGPAYSGGVFTDFFIDPGVEGSGISSVTINTQFGGISLELVEDSSGEFTCDDVVSSPCEDIGSLAEISALGDLTFVFVGTMGENDSVTIPLADYDPGPGQPGFPGVVFPTNGATDVATDATLEWTTPPAWVDAISVRIEDIGMDETTDEVLFIGDPVGVPVGNTTWMPSGMVGDATYRFELSFFEAIQVEDPRTTTGTRDFEYTGAFESYNESFFMVPEPGVIALNAAALLTVFGIGRLRTRSRRTDR